MQYGSPWPSLFFVMLFAQAFSPTIAPRIEVSCIPAIACNVAITTLHWCMWFFSRAGNRSFILVMKRKHERECRKWDRENEVTPQKTSRNNQKAEGRKQAL